MAAKTLIYIGKMVAFKGAYGEIKRGTISFIDEKGYLNGKDTFGNKFIIKEKDIIN